MTTEDAIRLMMIDREALIIRTVMIQDIPYDIVTATAMMNIGNSMLRELKVSPSEIEDLFLRLASLANKATKETEKEKNG